MSVNFRNLAAILMIILFSVSPVWATCGGGGGGGVGGMSGGGGSGAMNPGVYIVPWNVRAPKDPPAMGLVLYWFPATLNELQKSSLRESRVLSLYAGQCVSMELADNHTANAAKLVGESKLPVAVLATPDGTPVSKLENTNGKLKVGDLEKLLQNEVKQRETSLDASLKDARSKAAAGDREGAVKLYQSVLGEKCMFPRKAKDAAKELKKLGVDVARIPDAPVFQTRQSAQLNRRCARGSEPNCVPNMLPPKDCILWHIEWIPPIPLRCAI